jgi:hypothetical protein
MRRAGLADAPGATVLKFCARERREGDGRLSELPTAPARIIVFPGMSLAHLQALAASMRIVPTQPRPSSPR